MGLPGNAVFHWERRCSVGKKGTLNPYFPASRDTKFRVGPRQHLGKGSRAGEKKLDPRPDYVRAQATMCK